MQGRGFFEAGSLLVGDKLVSANGDDLIVEDNNIVLTEEPVLVYNFQVEDFHTYFVGKTNVWVHNDQCPVPEPRKSEKHTTADGEPLTYKSHTKHTRGQSGNKPDAGIEPRNSFELFEDSRVSSENGKRYTYEKSTDTVHRFSPSSGNGTEWHWSGSEHQGSLNSLKPSQIPGDIQKIFKKEYSVKWKGRKIIC